MNLSIQSWVILAIIAFSIILTIKSVFISKELIDAIDPIISGIADIITFFIFIMFYENLDSQITIVLTKFFPMEISQNGLIHVLLLGILFILIKIIAQQILRFINRLIFSNSILNRKNKLNMALLSIIFGFIRGAIIVVLLFMSLSIYNSMASESKRIGFFNSNEVYSKVSNIVSKSQVVSISNDLHKKVSEDKVTYYNGITIDKGVESNDEINKKAIEITEGEKSEKAKAKIIYTWIGSNITYDDKKADDILKDGKECESGAIVTFNTRKGICLDYACLYSAMAKAVGLKNRVIVGEVYNGSEYVGHAWNQVFLSKENRWINVDSTFYMAGDYFDSTNFNSQYRESSVAGEF